jgi:hypothetical protein
MLKFIGHVVLFLTVVVSKVIINNDKQISHCPNGSDEINSDESITGLSCVNLDCPNEIEFCWGSTICHSSHDTSCELLEGLLCQIEETMSSTFKICIPIPLEILAVNNSSEVAERLSTEVIPSIMDSPGVERLLSLSTLKEDKVNTLSKSCVLS